MLWDYSALGLTLGRQPSAEGTRFVSLEDETGSVQVIVWADVYAADRSLILAARLLAVTGKWQHQNDVRHLLARNFEDFSPWLGRLPMESRDFRCSEESKLSRSAKSSVLAQDS